MVFLLFQHENTFVKVKNGKKLLSFALMTLFILI